eukprot:gb/GEZN01007964.1/.p1 GENE.gb/GEZN01007964.1/~~gb/GEZN01007964.1/.p1  ORF type:complete len:494 (+),score=30.46 gb/GEZN01007964.1/:31-1482(+)
MTTASSPSRSTEVDVLVIGAGVSGIGAGYYLKHQLKTHSFKILERREAIGGTWGFFKYPGFRNDSDMYSFSFSFHPWDRPDFIVQGGEILTYLKEIVATYGLGPHILCNQHCLNASWSSQAQRWTVTTSSSVFIAKFLFCCTGYYDYDKPFMPEFKGLQRFKGTVAHAQNWSEDIDYKGKRVILIGSGATAITVLPAMAKLASHLTLLQRSPTYIFPIPRRLQNTGFFSGVRKVIGSVFGRSLLYRCVRWYFVGKMVYEYGLCRRFPKLAKKFFMKVVKSEVPPDMLVHFTPSYDPWDQRVCACPDSDFFQAVSNKERVSVVTDHIEEFTPRGIKTRSGQELKADVIMVATGLKLAAYGKMTLDIDGEVLGPDADLSKRFFYKGCLMSGIPNFWLFQGYANASWTLKVDLTAQLAVEMLRDMKRRGKGVVCAKYPDASVHGAPMFGLQSSYIKRDIHRFPQQGNRFPWTLKQNYILDWLDMNG